MTPAGTLVITTTETLATLKLTGRAVTIAALSQKTHITCVNQKPETGVNVPNYVNNVIFFTEKCDQGAYLATPRNLISTLNYHHLIYILNDIS